MTALPNVDNNLDQALAAAAHLVAHGVPLFISKPALEHGEWNPVGGTQGCGYWLPRQWQRIEPDLGVIDQWRPGDALAAVMGHTVDLLDVDPRNGGGATKSGLMDAGLWPRSYGTAATPSGGTHDFIRALGERSRDDLAAGLDVKGGDAHGEGRGFAWIAPTVKLSKSTGEIAAYRWVTPPQLDEIDTTDDSGEEISHMIRMARTPKMNNTSTPYSLPATIRAGQRDKELFKYASSLRARNVPVSEAMDLMRKAFDVNVEQPAGDHYPLNNALRKIDEAWAKFEAGPSRRMSTIVAGRPESRLATPSSSSDVGTTDALTEETPHRGQVRMAYRLAQSHTGHLLHVHGLGWHAWDGTRWAEDDAGAARRAVLEVLKDALFESFTERDKDLRTDVGRCESASGIDGVLTIASALTPFAAIVRDLDTDPYLLNVANGTLDLRTLELRTHAPSDRITKITRAAWRPETASAAWADFIAAVLPDRAVREFLQRLIGVSLLGKVVEHVLAIEVGTGANGKGTAYKAQLWALGDYASTAEPDLFMAREGAHPTGEMDLRGRRLVVVSESDKDRRLAEATMKRLTGGDPIKARRMRADFVEFEPSHTPLLVTNHLPKVTGDDPAIWRRVRVIPFEVTFAGDQQDTTLDDRLRLDADSVLAWAVTGYSQYVRDGLAEPEAVRVATERYQLDSDALSRFLEERCLTGEHYRCPTGELFEAWSHWCNAEGVDPGTKKAFGLSLDRKGYTDGRTRTGRFRQGIALFAEESDD